jgi:hypothetical protein
MKISVHDAKDQAAAPEHPQAPSASEEQALIRFAFYCEESALELAARLRVLARSISTGPDGLGRFKGRTALYPVSYASLRSQFEDYLAFVAMEGLSEGNPHFLIIQNYLAGLLPADIDREGPKQQHQDLISLIEDVTALLSERAMDAGLTEADNNK